MEEKWKEAEVDKEKEVEEKERTIRELKTRLQHKERLLHVSEEHARALKRDSCCKAKISGIHV